MKKFWETVNTVFDVLMNIIFTVILIGGGAWCIKDIFFS